MQEIVKRDTSTIEFEVKVKRFDKTCGKLVDAIDFSTKMTKADSGKCACAEETINISIEPSGEDCPRVFIYQNSKPTKADAGIIA
jgi:hypothetical protein